VVMPLLARRKRQVADALDSNAARADAAQTMACVWLSAVVLIGLALNAALDWWWADPVAALAVVVLLLNEGREALTGDNDDD
jgi:divalent metal cation (Fe/Co/Zn/Cd) transporter